MSTNLYTIVELLIMAQWENKNFISYMSWLNIFVYFSFQSQIPMFQQGALLVIFKT